MHAPAQVALGAVYRGYGNISNSPWYAADEKKHAEQSYPTVVSTFLFSFVKRSPAERDK